MDFRFPILLDGAMGTQLYKRGYQAGYCPEKWCLEHRDEVIAIQRAYVNAGSDIIYAPTFGANRVSLENNKIFGKVEEYNTQLVGISREAAGADAHVAGDITSCGAMLSPMGSYSFEDIYNIYVEQASALEKAGVDLYIIETIMNVAEARAAVLAVRSVSDKPIFVTFSCNEKGRTMTGTDVCAALVIMQRMGVDAFGLNCSVGPKELVPQIRRLSELAEVPLIAKPNAGLPRFENGHDVYDISPSDFASYVPELAEAGTCIFGGCCGTDENFISAVKEKFSSVQIRRSVCTAQGITAATERDVFTIDPDTSYSEVFDCDDDLEDNIMDSDPDTLIAVSISSEDDISVFAECQYAVRNPLCIVCDDAVLLEKALRAYQGIALYDGALSEEALASLERKYGLITGWKK
ncbi:MAG: homocysteine S-methyltransferase family protein [Eubacteriales bacterium]|nr:homocysteine S-methyltransferase family protein [Eubacteriales bacterium]